MHTAPTIKNWMHHVHDDAVKVAHYTEHMLHEKSFWGIVLILALVAGLFTAIVLFGNAVGTELYNNPMLYY